MIKAVILIWYIGNLGKEEQQAFKDTILSMQGINEANIFSNINNTERIVIANAQADKLEQLKFLAEQIDLILCVTKVSLYNMHLS